jgi:formylglycine-generating enzyme required for sulfatase activity
VGVLVVVVDVLPSTRFMAGACEECGTIKQGDRVRANETIQVGGIPFQRISGGDFLVGEGIELVPAMDLVPEERISVTVRLEDFFVATTALDRSNWNRFAQRPVTEADGRIIYCSWDDATAWASRMCSTVDGVVRLITEVEWEYAASNGGQFPPYGASASRPPSRWGVEGMLLNYEWCLDTYRWNGIYPNSQVWTGVATDVDRAVPPPEGLPMVKSVRGSHPLEDLTHPAVRTWRHPSDGAAAVRLVFFPPRYRPSQAVDPEYS